MYLKLFIFLIRLAWVRVCVCVSIFPTQSSTEPTTTNNGEKKIPTKVILIIVFRLYSVLFHSIPFSLSVSCDALSSFLLSLFFREFTLSQLFHFWLYLVHFFVVSSAPCSAPHSVGHELCPSHLCVHKSSLCYNINLFLYAKLSSVVPLDIFCFVSVSIQCAVVAALAMAMGYGSTLYIDQWMDTSGMVHCWLFHLRADRRGECN